MRHVLSLRLTHPNGVEPIEPLVYEHFDDDDFLDFFTDLMRDFETDGRFTVYQVVIDDVKYDVIEPDGRGPSFGNEITLIASP